jgi:Trk K+ transport system NAD-binding subunit
MSRKLIIGCGYLGERVARAWLESSNEVAVLTRSHESAERFRAQGLVPFVGDIHDPTTLTALPNADTLLYAVGFDRNSDRTRIA